MPIEDDFPPNDPKDWELPNRFVEIDTFEVDAIKGFISDVKFWPGKAKWTENFTPPTEPYNYRLVAKRLMKILLLMHYKGTLFAVQWCNIGGHRIPVIIRRQEL